jgi:uroporphyrinogen decarboxylase
MIQGSSVNSQSKFINALRGVRSETPPMWMMRQAGRYLPEYRKLREGNSMLQMVMTPELACEVTLQPLRRFPLDAAIIFADILTPLIGMGLNLEFKKGEGPVIDNPVRTARDVENLRIPEPKENVGYTLDAIRLVVSELKGKTPLIGFCGAPFTLSCYLIQGESPGDLEYTKGLMVGEPETWHALQTKLVKLSADYLVAQVEAGCESLQIFDSWLGFVGPREYDRFVEPYLKALVDDVRSRVSVPIVFFATSVAGLFPRISKLLVDAFGVDWRVSLLQARGLLGRDTPLQGNLDPQILAGPWEYVRASAKAILDEAKGLPSHIFNLGHGILPHTPVENVERLVEYVGSHRA